MIQTLELEFLRIHGETFSRQPNICKNLVAVFKQKFKEISDDIINLFARSRIYFRCSFLNKKASNEAIITRIKKREEKVAANLAAQKEEALKRLLMVQRLHAVMF